MTRQFNQITVPIAMDHEIVGTGYDDARRMCSYTVSRGGRQWTIEIALDDLNKHGFASGHKTKRQNHVAGKLHEAMQGPSDDERAAAS